MFGKGKGKGVLLLVNRMTLDARQRPMLTPAKSVGNEARNIFSTEEILQCCSLFFSLNVKTPSSCDKTAATAATTASTAASFKKQIGAHPNFFFFVFHFFCSF